MLKTEKILIWYITFHISHFASHIRISHRYYSRAVKKNILGKFQATQSRHGVCSSPAGRAPREITVSNCISLSRRE